VYGGIDYLGTYGKNMGTYSLELVGLQTEKYWLWVGVAFIGAMYIVFIVLSWFMLEYYRFEQPETSDLANTGSGDKADSTSASPRSSGSSDYTLAQTPRRYSNTEFSVELKPSTERKITPVTLAFKDLWYTVPNPQNPKEGLDLLKGISGYALPGTITALMGSSGAGKTTLMDVIAGRKTGGKIQGQILLNGHPATPLAIQRSTGYCEQMDIHSEASTFREAITFSSFLRQGEDVPNSEKYDWVEECLDLLDLRPIADKIIRGSSVEQMKRLTIGVELAARPSVLFLDEPTSGLDARSAKMVMDSVRKVANTGVTVVCTIHQPSEEVFHVFNSLLLLKRGGYTVYFGELGKNASELVNYLLSVPGTKPLPKGYNPATWMLEVIGAGVGNAAGQSTDFVDIFSKSAKRAVADEMLSREGMTRPASGVSAVSFASKRAASNSTQAYFLMERFLNLHWRTPSYNLTRFGVQLSMGVIFGATYATLKYQTYQGINGSMAMLFLTILFSSFIAYSSVVPVIIGDRAAFYRERASQTYNAFWYFFAAVVVEIPYVFSGALLFSAVVFPSVGFVGVGEFFFFWFILALFLVAMTYFGMLLAFLLPAVEAAVGFGILLINTWSIFVGFNPPASAIPKGYKWLYQLTPHRYALEAISTVVLGNCDSAHPDRIACKTLVDGPPALPKDMSISAFLGTFYGMSYDHVWRDIVVIVVFAAVFAILALISLRFVNHMKR
jgi:ABC-type multidrug transport system ATPase subunit/ABC-type multidrug transport system permease subunit